MSLKITPRRNDKSPMANAIVNPEVAVMLE